jgi:hypothetical protein
MLGIEIQHLIGGKFWRIEKTEPMLVMPTRGTDANPPLHAGNNVNLDGIGRKVIIFHISFAISHLSFKKPAADSGR